MTSDEPVLTCGISALRLFRRVAEPLGRATSAACAGDTFGAAMELTRRSFLAGLGSVTVGLLFARKLDAVLDSLERDLVAEQQTANQEPCAADIVVQPQMAFRADRLVVPSAIAPLFVIEDICIGGASQFAGSGISAELFDPSTIDSGLRMDTAGPATAIRFRVRYIGKDPRGARFTAALLGRSVDGGRLILPIDSGVPIVA